MKTLYVIFFLAGILSSGYAQTGIEYDRSKFNLTQYTDENGLPQNTIKSIAADENGFIWLSTENGLVRFDGQQFYIFDKSNLPLTTNSFFSLKPRIDINQAYTRFSIKKSDSTERRYPKIPLVAGIDDNVAYMIEAGRIVRHPTYTQMIKKLPYMEAGKDSTYIAASLSFENKSVRPPKHYIIMVPGEKGSFYVCHPDKIEFYALWKKKFEVTMNRKKLTDFFTIGNQLFYLENEGKITRVGQHIVSTTVLEGDILLHPGYRDKKNDMQLIWNSASDQAFIYLDKNLYAVRVISTGRIYTTMEINDLDFISNGIAYVYYDEFNQRFFLASITKGLLILTKRPFQTVRSELGITENIFYAQTPFGPDAVLSPLGVVAGLTTPSDRPKLPAFAKNMDWDRYSILTDKRGQIWTKELTRVLCFNGNGTEKMAVWDIGDQVSQLYEGPDGIIWIGTQNRGLYSIAKAGAAPKQRFNLDKGAGVSYIMQESKNVLWVGTNKGLYRLYTATGKKEPIKGTEGMYIRSIYIHPGKQAQVWFSTYENGFHLYQGEKLTSFPLDQNKYLAATHCIVLDKKGFFWMPTNHGLFQISHQDLLNYARKPFDLYYQFYDKSYGFGTNEFNGGCQPCALRLANGYLSLPSLDGLVWFNPEKINPDTPGRTIIADRYGEKGEVRTFSSDTLTLPLDPEQVVIYFATPYFGHKANLQASYSLVENGNERLTQSWLPVIGGSKSIQLGNIKSGTYLLTIRLANGFGTSNYTYKKIRIIVPPHWYQTVWFRVFCVFIILMAIFIYFRLRVRYLKKMNQKLELAITTRTGELQHTLNALRESENELSRQMHIQSRLVASISHDVKTPLKFVRSASRRMSNIIQQKDFEYASEINATIENTISGMYDLMVNLTGFIKTQVYGGTVKLEPVNLYNLVALKINLFSTVIQEHNNIILNEVPKTLSTESHAHLLSIVLHNLLDNANKYCRNGQIRIYSYFEKSMLRLIISDSGPGMPAPLTQWLNTPPAFDHIDNLKNLSGQFGGLGLIIVKEISSLLHIKILVEVNNGTKIHLIFENFPTDNLPENNAFHLN
ncbi:Adaptive-response sensory-kinase SasA [Dyadobacter sp. CECT 9275]|uniref:Adaptive-response sensory-kinase SasA n=1 Tax=Dyadobacter helix TaxID=2822344 RepID=A0A916JGQ3_9BACT|nr:two-component regulator propeller domain-containing protein [Dyadobacter sp. CECT 9275]CAG5017093.1 Adaptive-response sensory-kinase SasA [Dyadobacter sp. CECT 9275]